MKKLTRSEFVRYQPASLQKKLLQTSSFLYFPLFSLNGSLLLLPKRIWNCVSTFSFRKYKRKVVLLAIYLFNQDSSKSTLFMQNMTFDVVLSTVFVKQTSWNSSFFAIHFCSTQKVKRKHYQNILLFAQSVCFDMYLFVTLFRDENSVSFFSLPKLI